MLIYRCSAVLSKKRTAPSCYDNLGEAAGEIAVSAPTRTKKSSSARGARMPPAGLVSVYNRTTLRACVSRSAAWIMYSTNATQRLIVKPGNTTDARS